jgi:hypothetical protein
MQLALHCESPAQLSAEHQGQHDGKYIEYGSNDTNGKRPLTPPGIDILSRQANDYYQWIVPDPPETV